MPATRHARIVDHAGDNDVASRNQDPFYIANAQSRPPKEQSAWFAPAFLLTAFMTLAGVVWNAATSASDLKHINDKVEEQRRATDERRTSDRADFEKDLAEFKKDVENRRAANLKLVWDQFSDIKRDIESRRNSDDAFQGKRGDYLQQLDARLAKLENQIYYLVLNKPDPKR